MKHNIFSILMALSLCCALAIPTFAATQSPLSQLLTQQKTALSALSGRVSDALYHVNNLDRVGQKTQNKAEKAKNTADQIFASVQAVPNQIKNHSYGKSIVAFTKSQSQPTSEPSTTREYFTNRVQNIKYAIQPSQKSRGYSKADVQPQKFDPSMLITNNAITAGISNAKMAIDSAQSLNSDIVRAKNVAQKALNGERSFAEAGQEWDYARTDWNNAKARTHVLYETRPKLPDIENSILNQQENSYQQFLQKQ